MINSRSLDDLHPYVAHLARLLKAEVEAELGVSLIFTSTHRDNECQAMLYAQGRTTKGPNVTLLKPMGDIVTNAGPGESFHNYRVAFDVVPVKFGKAIWNSSDPIWDKIGAIGEKFGLEWAGRWKGKLREKAHFQFTGGLKLEDLRRGKSIVTMH